MMDDLSKIINSLYIEKSSGKSIDKKIIFIVGNGILQVCNILNDDEIIKEAAGKKKTLIKGTDEFINYKWKHFEAARYYSYYHRPSFAHYCIYLLAKDGLCQDIITTNYDLFFDAIW
jgi:hypothetical protein